MTRILQEPKNALLKQYIKLFELEDIKLTFEKEAIEYIALRAMEFGLGARGLRSICEEVLTEAMFELPSDDQIKEFVVSKEYAEKQLSTSKFSHLKVA
jgi:ATP-dependent Clp protease ATP-binding subunit ClpX